MDNVKDVLEKRLGELKDTVNSKDNSIDTVNSNNSLTVEQKINSILEEENIAPEGIAQMLATGLEDERSLPYYKILAKQHPASILLETLHYVQSVSREKVIRYKPVYYLAILRAKGFRTKFKKETGN